MISYVDSIEGITPNQLHGFFEGWINPPSPEIHLKVLANSYRIVLAVDDETGNVVGFVTAISDGILNAYIPLLEVLRPYRRQGIGQELMRQMLEKLRQFRGIDLHCEKELELFYARFGMSPAFGMMVRNYEHQERC